MNSYCQMCLRKYNEKINKKHSSHFWGTDKNIIFFYLKKIYYIRYRYLKTPYTIPSIQFIIIGTCNLRSTRCKLNMSLNNLQILIHQATNLKIIFNIFSTIKIQNNNYDVTYYIFNI